MRFHALHLLKGVVYL